MLKRSNEFQRLVAMLTMLKSDGMIVHESVEVMEIASQERREVDVVAFGKVAGHQSAVFIECRGCKRPQDVFLALAACAGRHCGDVDSASA